jgi:hypothetical protein
MLEKSFYSLKIALNDMLSRRNSKKHRVMSFSGKQVAFISINKKSNDGLVTTGFLSVYTRER